MTKTGERSVGFWAIYATLLLSALASCGCLVLAAGATAGGAAAVGYAFYKGVLYNSYNAGLEDTRAAVRAALADLRMPLLSDEGTRYGRYLESRTPQGDRVRISLSTEPGKSPAEGTLTRVSVRVGLFGDKEFSERVLNQVDAHLSNPRLVPAASPGPIQPTAAFGPPQSPPPPVAK